MTEDMETLLRRLERLEKENQALREKIEIQVESGAAAIGDGAQAAGKKAVIAGDVGGDLLAADAVKIVGNVYLGPEPDNPQQAVRIYRSVVLHATAGLPLRGVDIGASDATQAQQPIRLSNVYIDLDTKTNVKVGQKKRRPARPDEPVDPRGEETRPLPALEALIQSRQMVLLGDPGGGKSTFVNFLAHCLVANALEPSGDWIQHLPGWPKKEAQLLPLLVVLRDFALSLPDKLPGKAEPNHLWEFIHARLKAQNLEFVEKPLCQALESGQVLLLLDGLDEVLTAQQRRFVRDAVTVFLYRYPANRCMVTCRVLSYQPPRPDAEEDLRLTQLPDFELAPFDEEKMQGFVDTWYKELERIHAIRSEDRLGLTQRLQNAVQRPDMKDLASNPLLLTVMALVHTHKGRLPDARALLYEETVDILLWRWEQIKIGGQEELPVLRQLLLEAGRTDVDLKRVLWEVAFQAHKQGAAGENNGLADISQYQLQKALAALKGDDHNWARKVVEAMKLRAGLLLERMPEVFTFPHRTFQEYLAGSYLASQAKFAIQAAALSQQGARWREVILLAVGRLVYLTGDMDKPLALAGELCPSRIDESQSMPWMQAWLAGDVLLEIGTARVKDSALGRDLLERVQTRLVDLLQQGRLAPRERAESGSTLARLGDPRFDPDKWYLPREPVLGFVEIPAGEFLMGSDPEIDEQADNDEKPQHRLDLTVYYLGRYPVTVAQFRAFVQDSGHKPQDADSLEGLPNHPVVWVTWYDALAYSRWLGGKLRDEAQERVQAGSQEALWQGLASGALQVSLSSEAEWEKATRGADGRIYSWGDQPDPEKANYRETGIGTTSAVGCFPGGAGRYGLQDMSGNVFEWTRSLWGEYPYPSDGPELSQREYLDADENTRRVLRGGAFYYDAWDVRCAFRLGCGPYNWFNYIGFRVVVSPVNH